MGGCHMGEEGDAVGFYGALAMLVERLGAEGTPPGEPCWDPPGWVHLGRAWPGTRTVHPSRPGSWVTRNHAPGRGFS